MLRILFFITKTVKEVYIKRVVYSHILQSMNIYKSKRGLVGKFYKNCQGNWLPSEMAEKDPTIYCNLRRANTDEPLVPKDAEKT